MEGPHVPEAPIAPVGLDQFLEHLLTEVTINGELLENDDHSFFAWLVERYPRYKDIDGVSLRELYEKNVLESGMRIDRFEAYCNGFKFPNPWAMDPESPLHHYVHQWNLYKQELQQNNDAAYLVWADEHHIDTRPGAQMRFIDIEGDEYLISTDRRTRGRIVQKNGQTYTSASIED
jgi:hypothetical protein